MGDQREQEKMTDENRVKEVYPDAHQDAYSPAIWASDSRQTLLVIGKNWHDAASRLPKEESVPDDCLDITDDGKVIIAASPAKEPAPQTFEEWWAKGIIADNYYHAYRNACQVAWNAAKASSPVVAGGESDNEAYNRGIDAAIAFLTEWKSRRDYIQSAGFFAVKISALKQPLIKDVRGTEDWSANDDAHMDAQDKLRGLQ